MGFVRPDPDFHNDMHRLIRGIEEGVSALRAALNSRRFRESGAGIPPIR